MRNILLSTLLLSAAAPALAHECAPDAELQSKSYALWITDKTNPDEAVCVARLSWRRCYPGLTPDGVTREPGDYHVFGDALGRHFVTLGSRDGAISLSLAAGGELANLPAYPRQRVLQRGIGVDAVSAVDASSRLSRVIGNVFLIPVENVVKPEACPAS